MSVEKFTVRIGKTPASDPTAWQNAWAGIPIGDSSFASRPPGQYTPATRNEVGVMVNFPAHRHTHGPVRAIAIAPDSPIESVDLVISGGGSKNVHRIAPGCPWIGVLSDDDQVRVVPNRPIPLLTIQAYGSGFFEANVIAFDCTVSPDDSLDGAVVDMAAILAPVRLNVYRGESAPPIHNRRAPYRAHMLFAVPDHTRSAIMYVIVDGRRRVRVIAGQDKDAAGDVSITVEGVEAFSSLITATSTAPLNGDRRLDAPSLTELLAATALDAEPDAPLIFDYDGNPYYAFKVTASCTVDNSAGYVQVLAWDD